MAGRELNRFESGMAAGRSGKHGQAGKAVE